MASNQSGHPRQAAGPHDRAAPGVDDLASAGDHHRGRRRVESRHLLRQARRAHEVVSAHELEQLPLGRVGHPVPVAWRPSPRFCAQELDTAVCLELLQHLPRAVGRGLVGDDELEVGERLVEHRAHRRLDKGGVLVGGHHDRDPRTPHDHPPSWWIDGRRRNEKCLCPKKLIMAVTPTMRNCAGRTGTPAISTSIGRSRKFTTSAVT